MDIRTLTSTQRIDRNSNSRIKTPSNESYGKLSDTSSSNRVDQNSADKVSISSASASDDLSFAKQVYQKLDDNSLDRVRSVRSKAEQGYYTSESSIKKLAAAIQHDIIELESDSMTPSLKQAYPVDLEKLRQNLAENPEIITEVATRLAKILSNL
jgi:hypothetical protein